MLNNIQFSFWQDVAIKVFSRQDYSDDLIHSFRQEVSNNDYSDMSLCFYCNSADLDFTFAFEGVSDEETTTS